jgi:hypothetical protein
MSTSPEVIALLQAIAHAAHNYELAWDTASWQRSHDLEDAMARAQERQRW